MQILRVKLKDTYDMQNVTYFGFQIIYYSSTFYEMSQVRNACSNIIQWENNE